MHVTGRKTRIDLNPKGGVELKLRDHITISPLKVNLQSIDVADEEHTFFFPKKTRETEE